MCQIQHGCRTFKGLLSFNLLLTIGWARRFDNPTWVPTNRPNIKSAKIQYYLCITSRTSKTNKICKLNEKLSETEKIPMRYHMGNFSTDSSVWLNSNSTQWHWITKRKEYILGATHFVVTHLHRARSTTIKIGSHNFATNYSSVHTI